MPRSSSSRSKRGSSAASKDSSSAAGAANAAAKEECEASAEAYLENCERFDIKMDPSVYIALRTGWETLKPSSSFGEGDLLPLMGVLDNNEHVTCLNMTSASMRDPKTRAHGNGNSNARALRDILRENSTIQSLNLSRTGLDDEGVREICSALEVNKSITHLDLTGNKFTEKGATALRDALEMNKNLQELDVTNNQLGFESIKQLEDCCIPAGITLKTNGNYMFEEILNAVSHGIAFFASIVGGVVMMNAVVESGHSTDYHYWGCMVYSLSLIYLFLASSLYHSFFMMPTTSMVLQILDNIGIYLLIAGSYTPILLIGLHNSPRGRWLLVLEWLTAFLASCFTIYADLSKPWAQTIKLSSFLAMGFACLIVFPEIKSELSESLVFLFGLGGALYVTGVVFFLWGDSVPIYHVVWHLFVVAAATCHWLGIYMYVCNKPLNLGLGLTEMSQTAVEGMKEMMYQGAEMMAAQAHK